jgi:hypothetical protein
MLLIRDQARTRAPSPSSPPAPCKVLPDQQRALWGSQVDPELEPTWLH